MKTLLLTAACLLVFAAWGFDAIDGFAARGLQRPPTEGAVLDSLCDTASFGVLPAEMATSLVMVLNELLINAVEHGFPEIDGVGAEGEVVVSAHRQRKQLHVTVADNGAGLPEAFDAEQAGRLGLQIVRRLRQAQLFHYFLCSHT